MKILHRPVYDHSCVDENTSHDVRSNIMPTYSIYRKVLHSAFLILSNYQLGFIDTTH